MSALNQFYERVFEKNALPAQVIFDCFDQAVQQTRVRFEVHSKSFTVQSWREYVWVITERVRKVLNTQKVDCTDVQRIFHMLHSPLPWTYRWGNSISYLLLQKLTGELHWHMDKVFPSSEEMDAFVQELMQPVNLSDTGDLENRFKDSQDFGAIVEAVFQQEADEERQEKAKESHDKQRQFTERLTAMTREKFCVILLPRQRWQRQ